MKHPIVFLFLTAMLGLVIGVVVNRFVDANGWIPRKRSPFRPQAFAVIILCVAAAPLLFWWECVAGALSGNLWGGQPPVFWPLLQELLPQETPAACGARFFLHLLLFTLLLAATLIDFEDRIIPDNLTVFGTLAGLTFLWLSPGVLLPATEYWSNGYVFSLQHSLLFWFTPHDLATASPLSNDSGLLLVPALLIWYGWCFAMLDRRWYPQLGWKRAAIVFWRRLRRSPLTRIYGGSALFGTLLISCALLFGSKIQAHALFTGLVGLAVGGGIVWAVRLVARLTLHMEAMGFGDVTFMAMIGAFLGWQPTLLIFALAPFAGVVIGIISYLLGRGTAIPFGPFLAAAAVIVLLFWPHIWLKTELFFSLGIPAILLGLVGCLILMGLMLAAWYRIKMRLLER